MGSLRMKSVRLLESAAVAALLCLSAAPQAYAKTLHVLASTYPVYLLTRAVAAQSPEVRVELLIPARTGCPHDYAPSPSDMRRLAEADVVVLNGLGMEAFLDRALGLAERAAVIDSSAGISQLPGDGGDQGEDAAGHARHPGEAHGQHARQGQGHGHAHGVNPHAFASPAQAAHMARNIGAGLLKAAPDVAANCPQSAELLAARLETLATRLKSIGNRAANKKVVLLHDGLAYLLRDAGLDCVAVMEDAEDAAPSAARRIELARMLARDKPALIVGEAQYSDKPARSLAAELGVPSLSLDSAASGPADPPINHYEAVMGQNCRLLEASLVR